MKNVQNLGRLFALVVFGLMLSFTAQDVQAQTVPAGTLIGNQASATYQDGAGNTRTVTSNVVQTEVTQVASLTIEANGSRLVSPGGQVYFPHTITNNGNAPDVFNLSEVRTSANFTFGSVQIYADANGDGVPDDLNPITITPSVPIGGTFKIVVVGVVPGSATSGQSETITISAESDYDNGVTDDVVDTITVSLNAVISVNKSMSSNSGAPGSGPYTITLGYTNTGNNAATNLVITDLLPAGFVYEAGSGRWSQTGSGSPLTDNGVDAEPGAGIAFDWNVTTGGTMTATISNIGAGQSGTVSFQVTIDGGATPGNINNVAPFNYNDGAGPQSGTSNTFVFTVTPGYAVSGVGETVASATQGSTVTFTNVITNDGNQTDVFNITIQSNDFPAGSSVIMFKSDGVSPLLDTNGDGLPDTGPVAASADYDVVLKVTLPSSATGGPFTITKRATSINDPSKFDEMDDVLTLITGNTVDLTAIADVSTATPAQGFGAYTNGDDAADTKTTNPGQTVRFTVFVNNTSAVSDNFDLIASQNQDFGTLTLPTGWAVSFRNSSEQVIANTGVINGGGTNFRQVFVDFIIPAGTSPGDYDVFVRSKSPATNATDRIRLTVTVNTVREISITPNNSGQIFPGGSVTYVHTITNVGNVTENNPANSTITLNLTNSNGGFNAVIYLDTNNNGEIDNGESIVSNAANLGELIGGQSKQLIVKVTATPGVNEGLNNTTTISAVVANVGGGSFATAVPTIDEPADVSATDVTIVISSNVSLVKRQALDTDGDGNEDGAFQTTLLTAEPGQGIVYQITITNLGTTPIDDVNINDAIPPYTTYNNLGNSAVFISNNGNGGTINHVSGTIVAQLNEPLAPGASVIIRFGVTIDN